MLKIVKNKIIIPILAHAGSRRAKQVFHKPPIVLGGCGRSGTTLLLSILSAHPAIHALPFETGIFSFWQSANDPLGIDPNFQEPTRLHRFYRNILRQRIPATVSRWCEKTPTNVRHLERIFAYYRENVRFIHIIRDGRDVMTSRHPENPDAFWVEPQRWVNDVRQGLAYKDHPQVLTIRYEDLILEHKTTVGTICDFIEEEYVPELKQWFENATLRKDQAWFKPLQRLHSSSIGRWKKPEFEQRIEELTANDEVVRLLVELGYLK